MEKWRHLCYISRAWRNIVMRCYAGGVRHWEKRERTVMDFDKAPPRKGKKHEKKKNICFFRWKIEIYFIEWTSSVIFSRVAATRENITDDVTRWNKFRSFTEKIKYSISFMLSPKKLNILYINLYEIIHLMQWSFYRTPLKIPEKLSHWMKPSASLCINK